MNKNLTIAQTCQHEINNALSIIMVGCKQHKEPEHCMIGVQRVAMAVDKMLREMKELAIEESR